MVDPDESELAAMDYASQMAAQYLEELGTYDIATFTPDEWGKLIEVIVTGYVNYMQGERGE